MKNQSKKLSIKNVGTTSGNSPKPIETKLKIALAFNGNNGISSLGIPFIMKKKFLKRFSDLPPEKRSSQTNWSNDNILLSIRQDLYSSDNYINRYHNTDDDLLEILANLMPSGEADQ